MVRLQKADPPPMDLRTPLPVQMHAEPDSEHVPFLDQRATPLPSADDLQNVFIYARKRVVGTTVPQSIYDVLQSHTRGTSGFLEDAISAFEGSLAELLDAAAEFERRRKHRGQQEEVLPINGRVPVACHERVLELEALCKERKIKRISRSKIVAGFIQKKLIAGGFVW